MAMTLWGRYVSACACLLALTAVPVQAQEAVEEELRRLRALVEQSTRALEDATRRIEELEAKAESAEGAATGAGSIRAGRAKEGVELQVYGHLNQAFLYADNGQTSRFDIVDNDNSGSRLGIRGKYENGPWTSGARLELAFEVNTTDELTFSTDGDNGTSASAGDGESDFLSLRWANVFFSHEDYGTINLGFGETATQGVAERDLSGTTLIAESDVDDIGGELQFGNATAAELGTGFEVDDFFNNLDGFRDSAISYHSPRIGGVQLKVAGRSADFDEGVSGVRFQPDASLNFKTEISGFKLDTAAGWRREPTSNNYIASASMLAPFGTNLTLAGGIETFDSSNSVNEPTQNFFYVKIGQQLNIFDIGRTSFSADFFRGADNSGLGPNGKQSLARSFGGGVVQQVKPLGAEVYAGARYFDVNLGSGNSETLDGILTVFSGARVRF